MRSRIGRWLRQLTPRALVRRAALFLARPEGEIDFGDLGRLTPISDNWGWDLGTPLDRHHIEEFLDSRASDIRGDVLEIGTSTYTRRFGGDRVASSDVLHVEDHHPGVTMVGDLTRPETLEPDRFDCVLLTQTLQFVEDPAAAIRSAHRILRPGGVALATFSGITKISRDDMDRWGHYFNFTTLSAGRLFERVFGATNVDVTAAGNVLTTTAFLYGIPAEQLPEKALTYRDRDYELVICVRAVKDG